MVSRWELRKWQREVNSLRKDLNKLEADLDLYSRLETDPEALERAALMRTELVLMRERLARTEEKIEAAKAAVDWSLNEILFMVVAAAGLFLLVLIITVYVLPALLSR
jgi:hypothetical protein